MINAPSPFSALLLAATLGAAHAGILLNEVHVNPPGQVNAADGDGNYEYVELVSTTGGAESTDGLWLLQVDVRGGKIGVVKEAWNLSGLSTGANGLLLLGDDYDGTGGGPWAGFKALATTVGDPDGFGGDNLDDNDAFCLLLVRNFTGTAETGGNAGTDIDHNDDGVPSVSSGTLPWQGAAANGLAGVVDSVGFTDRAEAPARLPLTTANLTRSGYDPGNVSRKVGNTTPNSGGAWYGGFVDGTSLLGVAFSATLHFGLTNASGTPAAGEATPGSPNMTVALPPAVFRINEVSLNPSGSPDGNAEYVELISVGRGNASLSGLTLVVVDSNNEPPEFFGPGYFGEIVEAWPLDGLATGGNGLVLLGDGYAPGQTPWDTLVQPGTAVADPPGMGLSDLGDNNGFTLLLVRGFNGSPATDSSAGMDVDTNDDGVIDTPRWTEVVDDLGFDQVDLLNPNAQGLGKTYAQARVTPTPAYDPDYFARRLGADDARSAAVWYGGDFGGNSRFAIGLRTDPVRQFFGGFKGEATPGAPNLAASRPAQGIFINELNFDPMESPDPNANNEEYIELIHSGLGMAGLHGLTLLVVDSSAPNVGEVREAISLSGLSTGPNGLVLVGDAYDNGTPYGAEVSALTNREDPSGYDAGDFERDKDGLVVMVVSEFAGSRGLDLDADDDGTFDQTPWSAVMDAVGFGAISDPVVARLAPPGALRTFARDHGDFRRSADAWHGGDFAGGGSVVAYGAGRFGISHPTAASPGRYNHTAEPATTPVMLNEVLVNLPGGTDGRSEFVELLAADGRPVSTNGLSVLVIDSSVGSNLTGNVGRVVEAWSLDGLGTGANGLLLLGDGYGTEPLPWTEGNAPAAATRLADPVGLDPDDIGQDGDNGALSVLLVQNFVGAVGDDLDLVGGAANAGDGSFDLQPWTQIVDAVAMKLWNTAPSVPPARAEGVVYGGVDLTQTGYTPDAVARLHGRTGLRTAVDWAGGDLTATLAFDVQRFPAGFAGALSPGRPNGEDPVDPMADADADGVPNFVEEAFGMNPQQADAWELPAATTVEVNGERKAAIVYTQLSGGSGTPGLNYGAEGFSYVVEWSDTLVEWTAATAADVAVHSVTDEPGTGLQRVVIRPLGAADTRFLRVRVTLQ